MMLAQGDGLGGQFAPTYGVGLPGANPINDFMQTLSRYSGPISQSRAIPGRSAPYMSMITTGNTGYLSLVEAPVVSIVIETEFAERAKELFDLCDIQPLQPGQKNIKYNIVHVGNSPFAQTADLVPGPKGQLSMTEQTVTTSRYAHMIQMEKIALDNTAEGKRAWALLERQQITGGITTAAAIIIGGLMDAMPAPLPFGIKSVKDLPHASAMSLQASIEYVNDCFGALMHPAGLSFLMQLVNREKTARNISGKFDKLVTDEGAVTSLANFYNSNPNLTLDDAKTITEITTATERLLDLKIVEVGRLPISPGQPSIYPFRNQYKMLHFMLVKFDDEGKGTVDQDRYKLKCYNRKYDYEEELKFPSKDAVGDYLEPDKWYILIRPSIWETSSGLMISNTKKPTLFLSRLFTELGINIHQLSVTQHSVFFGGFAVDNPGGIVPVPNLKVNGHVSGDGTDFATFGRNQGDFFSANGDIIMLKTNFREDLNPRTLRFLNPSGAFSATVPGKHERFNYEGKVDAGKIAATTHSVENTAVLTRGVVNKKMPCFMSLDPYTFLKGNDVKITTIGASPWGPGYSNGMVAKMTGKKAQWK